MDKQNRNRLLDAENTVTAWGMGRQDEGIKYKLGVTGKSRGCKAQRREYSQYYSNHYVWCPVGTTWGLDLSGGPVVSYINA